MKVRSVEKKSLSEIGSAPLLIVLELDIDCDGDRIFDLFEDEKAWTVWANSIENVTWTSPYPFSVGTTRAVMMKGNILGIEEFIAWERGKRMAFTFTESSMPNVASFCEDYQVESIGEGKVHLKWTVALWPDGVVAFIGFKLFGWLMKIVLGNFFKKFKKLAESDYATETPKPVLS